MPQELLPHFSPRSSDTGPNLGYRCDPLLKEKVIAFSFFKICLPPWSKCQKKLKNYRYYRVWHPTTILLSRSNQWIGYYKWGLTWKPKSQSVLYSPFHVSKMDYSVKVFCLKKGFVKLMIRLKRNTAQCAFAELLCAFKYSHWFNYSMFFKKTNVFLFCSLSSTLIRAGVAVQGPLVFA